eukprot:SAG11_NODE_578_length_8373_cov_28.044471_3_plen_194_part_00
MRPRQAPWERHYTRHAAESQNRNDTRQRAPGASRTPGLCAAAQRVALSVHGACDAVPPARGVLLLSVHAPAAKSMNSNAPGCMCALCRYMHPCGHYPCGRFPCGRFPFGRSHAAVPMWRYLARYRHIGDTSRAAAVDGTAAAVDLRKWRERKRLFDPGGWRRHCGGVRVCGSWGARGELTRGAYDSARMRNRF